MNKIIIMILFLFSIGTMQAQHLQKNLPQLLEIKTFKWDSESDTWSSSPENLKIYSWNESGSMAVYGEFSLIAGEIDREIAHSQLFFDNMGRIIRKIDFQKYNSEPEWIMATKEDYSYTSAGYEEENNVFSWDNNDSAWKFWLKRQTIRDKSEKEVLHTAYYIDSTGKYWLNNYRIERIYDNNDNLEETVRLSWIGGNDGWIQTGKTRHFYNNGLEIRNEYYNLDRETMTWRIRTLSEFSYDTDGNRIEQRNFNWDGRSKEWINHFKIEKTFNAEGYCTDEMYFLWDETEELWTGSSLKVYTYADGK